MEGNLVDYLKKFNEYYERLRSNGRDLYFFSGDNNSKWVFALPDRQRERNDTRVLMDDQDVRDLQAIFNSPGWTDMDWRKANILPYTQPESLDHFGLKSMERILSWSHSLVQDNDLDLH